MKDTQFVHLGVHSQFSLYDSLIKVDQLVKKAVECNMSAISISDDSNMFAAVSFYQKAMAAGIKPIISSEITVSYGNSFGKLTLISMNTKGYKNLIKIISDAYDRGRPSDDDLPVIPYEYVKENCDNLIVLSGANEGIIGRSILSGNMDMAKKFIIQLREDFGDRFYIELQRTGNFQDNQYVSTAVKLATLAGIPVVATNKVRFIDDHQFPAHEVRVADSLGITVSEVRDKYGDKYTPHQYFKSSEEMAELFSDIPSAIENTVHIANRCSVDIELYKNYLPVFPTPNGETESEYLKNLSYEGLMLRLKQNYPEKLNDAEFVKTYTDRLDFELNTIIQMGFPGYFLIVGDFIQWSKDNDIPVGPGRGSGAGSLVAYALKITDLDPLPYDLLFERFLNPERVSMPDFDVDFCMDKRDRVIQYCANKYGHKAVSQIITFGTLAAKAAVKSAARTMGYPYGVADRLSKAIPNEPGIKLSKALEVSLDLNALYGSDLDAKKIIDFALQIEGLSRQTGKHAGGVLISPTTLTDFTPTYCLADGTGYVSQFDKNDVETAGLVKFDFLGLKTLTIIDNAIKAVNKERAAEGLPPINIEQIPLDDPAVYEMYQKGETTAVFQVESRGMKELLKRLKPDRFEDLIALVALFRPGPLQSGMVDNFIDRKHGREEISYPDVNYQHPSLKEVLEPTYGIILYQEQVMKIAQVLAGYTLGGADMLRRAMGKKKPEEMAKQREVFKQGAIDNGIDGDLSMKIFDLVEKFAGYGFNKSHSAAYALVSYQTAWLKTHYPAAFMASVLSADSDSMEKVVNFAEEAKRMGVQIIPPSVNKSEKAFVSEGNDKIYFGLSAIKSFGDAAINDLISKRHEPFKDIFDFKEKCGLNKNAFASCIRAGLFDEFGFNRRTLLENVDVIVKYGKQNNSEAAKHQLSLLDESIQDSGILIEKEEMSHRERLIGEIQTLGLSVSGHLLDDYKEDCRLLSTGKLADLAEISMESSADSEDDSQSIWRDKVISTLCVINTTDIRTGKTGQRALLTIDDGSRQLDCVVFNNSFHKSQQYIYDHNIVYIKGKLVMDKKTESHKLIAFEVESLDSLREKRIDSVSIKLDSTKLPKQEIQAKLQKLNEFLKHRPEGGCGLRAIYIKSESESSELSIGSKKYRYDDELSAALTNIFGKDSVIINYKSDEKKTNKTPARNVEATKEELEEGARTRPERHKNIARLLDQAMMVMS